MVLAYELVIEGGQDVKSDQKEQDHCYIEMERQQNKG
jgi:hypothetical protein